MLKQEEGSFRGAGGVKLYYQTWVLEGSSAKAAGAVKGHVVITHGQGEHAGSYQRVAEALTQSQVKVWAWDLRGHGQSQGARGSLKDFSQYTQDYEIFLKRVVFPETQKQPVILLAHSMGGLIQLQTVLDDEDLKELPQILSAPFLGVAIPVPGWKEKLSVLAYQVAPGIALDNGIKPEMLTSDPEVLKEFSRDPLRHTKISSGTFEGAKVAMDAVLGAADYFTGPMLLLGPESDPVVSTEKFLKFAHSVPKGKSELHQFQGRKHEIFNDLGREEVFDVVRGFIKKQLK